MICVGVWSLLPPPIWNIENEHGWQVSHCASAAAIFIGWYVGLDDAEVAAHAGWTRMLAGTSTMTDILAVRRNASTELLRRRCHADTASMSTRPGHERRQQHVGVAPHEHRVGEHGADVVELGALGRRVDLVADRVLHPGVGRHDEGRGEGRSHRHHPDAGEVDALGQAVPAEEPEPEERRLEEEGGQALHGQRCAEHVAHVPAVGRPVHAELELLHEPGHHADGDVDDQQRPEEARQPAMVRVARAVPHRLQDRDEEGDADRDGHEQEVVDGRRGELDPREVDVHGVSSCWWRQRRA